MRCVLMDSNGLRGDCLAHGCMYWALLNEPDEPVRWGCVLDYFGLVGPKSDLLAKWLLELKLKNRRGRQTEVALDEAYASKARARPTVCSTSGAGYSMPRRPSSSRKPFNPSNGA